MIHLPLKSPIRIDFLQVFLDFFSGIFLSLQSWVNMIPSSFMLTHSRTFIDQCWVPDPNQGPAKETHGTSSCQRTHSCTGGQSKAHGWRQHRARRTPHSPGHRGGLTSKQKPFHLQHSHVLLKHTKHCCKLQEPRKTLLHVHAHAHALSHLGIRRHWQHFSSQGYRNHRC